MKRSWLTGRRIGLAGECEGSFGEDGEEVMARTCVGMCASRMTGISTCVGRGWPGLSSSSYGATL